MPSLAKRSLTLSQTRVSSPTKPSLTFSAACAEVTGARALIPKLTGVIIAASVLIHFFIECSS